MPRCRGAPALGRQGHKASPAAPATQGRLEPRPRAQGKLRGGPRALKAEISLRAVRASCQESEKRTDTTTPESEGNFQVAVSSGDVLRTNAITEKKRNLSEVTLSSNASH